jgi:Protein of unknown function (DUF1572)
MSTLSSIVSSALASEYRMRAEELHKWVDPLTEEQFWKNPFSYGNSAGHLVLHLSGNLSYYIGAQIAGTGYVRNRDLEFKEIRRPGKEDVLGKFDETIEMVVATIEKQTEEDWCKAYTGEREPESQNRFTAVFRCAVHFYHHIGQINFVCRELAK